MRKSRTELTGYLSRDGLMIRKAVSLPFQKGANTQIQITPPPRPPCNSLIRSLSAPRFCLIVDDGDHLLWDEETFARNDTFWWIFPKSGRDLVTLPPSSHLTPPPPRGPAPGGWAWAKTCERFFSVYYSYSLLFLKCCRLNHDMV